MPHIRLHLSLAFALALVSCTPNEPPADLAIQNVTVIDAANGAREAMTVLV